MNDRFLVNVIHLERMSGGAVEQDCVSSTTFGCRFPRAKQFRCRPLLHNFAHHLRPGKSRAAKTYAKPIEKAELDAFQHVRRYVAILRFGCEFCQRAGRIRQKWRLCAVTKISIAGRTGDLRSVERITPP